MENLDYIQTERLFLRKLTPHLYQFLFATYSDKDLMAFFALASREELEKEKDKLRKGIATHNRSFVIFQLLDIGTKQYMGWCGFHSWYIDHFRAEIGYGLTSDSFKRKGIMSEALKEVIKYGFEQMGLNRIEAFIGPDNTASIKLIKKLTFTKEGHLRQHYFKNNQLEDSLVFSLLRREYTVL